MVSFVASFVLSFFPLGVLDGIWDLTESVSEGFLTYSFIVGSGNGETFGVTRKNYHMHYEKTNVKYEIHLIM